MKYFAVLLVIMAVFTCMAAAGQKKPDFGNANDIYKSGKNHGKVKSKCLKGKMKNGKCIRSVLRVRSSDSDGFFEIPDVEDAHWADEQAAYDESDEFEEEV